MEGLELCELGVALRLPLLELRLDLLVGDLKAKVLSEGLLNNGGVEEAISDFEHVLGSFGEIDFDPWMQCPRNEIQVLFSLFNFIHHANRC